MDVFSLEKENCKIRFVSSLPISDYYEKNKEFLEFFDAKLIRENDESLPTLYYMDDPSESVYYQDGDIFVNYPKDKITPSNILYIGYQLLEREFGKKGLCTCHSSCVEKDGVATLFIGEAGAGKTSAAINLCINDDYSFISNDCSLIGLEDDKLKVFGGTKFIRLRYDSVEQNMPYLAHLFKNGDTGWTNKLLVLAHDIGMEERYEPVEIKNVIFLHIDNRKDTLQVSPGDNWRNNFLLYQNLSSHIRGHAATAVDYLGHPIGFIPSFDDKETYDKRMRIIDTINGLENYYTVSGNLYDTIDFVNGINHKDKQKVLRRDNNG